MIRNQDTVLKQILNIMSFHTEMLNAVNEKQQTALHIAVIKESTGAIKVCYLHMFIYQGYSVEYCGVFISAEDLKKNIASYHRPG